MNKNIFLYLIVFSMALFVVSCEDALEIEPEQELSIDAAFSDEATTMASLMGAYSRCQDLEVFGALPQVIAEYQADNVNFIGTFPTLQDINQYVTLSSNTSIEAIFRDNYRAILAANAVIQNAPGVDDPGFSDEEKAQVVAEAKFVRAMVYFNLLNMFAQPYNVNNGGEEGVALVLEPDVLNGVTNFPARSTVAECYAQIEKDLTEALPNLPADGTRIRATQGAANALLSRLYLYKGDNGNAASRAQMVIGNAFYAAATDYNFYDNETPEAVFSLDMSPTDNSRTGTGGWASYFRPAEEGARGDAPLSADLIAAFDPADKRLTDLTSVGANGETYSLKYDDPVTNSDNSPLIRISEMHLNAAEALTKSTNAVTQDILDLVNPLRQRAGLADWTTGDFADANELLTAILDERRKELNCEGHRKMDLLRNGMPLRTSGFGAGISSPGDDLVVLPIPQREIDLGSSLPQNPGY
ncbi:MAG: RagB/SusD family nutrient uptake outer membrane protein [Saprospiraceae bacterium]